MMNTKLVISQLMAAALMVAAATSCIKLTEPIDDGWAEEKGSRGGGGGGGGEVDPTQVVDISQYKPVEGLTFDMSGTSVLPVSGLQAGDIIRLTSRSHPGDVHTATVTASDEKNGTTVTMPAGFFGGMYSMEIATGAAVRTYGPLFVQLGDSGDVPKLAGKTLYGRVVDTDGQPVPNVSVSDGVFVSVTDNDGRYYLTSSKKYGYVFISVPSGYKVPVNRTIPQFFRRNSGVPSQYEKINFVVKAEANIHHRVMVFTDTHMANRTNDIAQFEIFKEDYKTNWNASITEGVPAYGISLGDLAWDEYWYKNNYNLESYCKSVEDMEMPIYNIPGNHDNDPYVADDFSSEGPWRKNLGPTYYSFNIGDFHYILMDDTIFLNAGGSPGVVGSLNFTQGFTNDQLKWLRNDLAQVPKTKTIVFGMHVQYTGRWRKENGTFLFNYNMPPNQRVVIDELLDGYTVHIISGHTHLFYTNHMSPKMMEHNIVGVCGTWWWTGYYTQGRCQICRDGSPTGYKIFEMGAANPTDVNWRFRPIDRPDTYQFRAYDLNNCLITRAEYCPAIKDNYSRVTQEIFRQYANGYDTARSDNTVLLNVFDWDRNWKVEMFEGDTSHPLTVTEVDSYDPLHTAHFNMNRMNSNSTAMGFATLMTSHLFTVKCSSATSSVIIRVTDPFGRVYTETMTRPRKLSDMVKSDKY